MKVIYDTSLSCMLHMYVQLCIFSMNKQGSIEHQGTYLSKILTL